MSVSVCLFDTQHFYLPVSFWKNSCNLRNTRSRRLLNFVVTCESVLKAMADVLDIENSEEFEVDEDGERT